MELKRTSGMGASKHTKSRYVIVEPRCHVCWEILGSKRSQGCSSKLVVGVVDSETTCREKG